MRKPPLFTCLAALSLSVTLAAADGLAQRGPAARRLPGLVQKKQLNPQLGGARDRLPGKPPLLGPKLGRPGNPNRARQLQIQRQRLMEAIGLSDDQRQRMEEISRSHEDEAIAIGRRIRQARNALDRAIMRPDYDEALVHRYTEELANAQADQIRLQSRLRAEKRSVLTSDQVIRLLHLEQERRRQMREERRELDKDGADSNPGSGQTRPPLEEVDLVSLLLLPF